MDQQQVVATADTFEQLLKHTHFMSLVLGVIFGWGFHLLTKYPLTRLINDEGWENWCSYAACAFGSALVCLLSWPATDKKLLFAWVLTVGVISPALWFGITHFVIWKYPNFAAAIKLKRISLDNDRNENDVRPPEPGPGPA